MRNTLPVRAKALRERLITLDLMTTNVAEAGLLEDLRAELAPLMADLSRAMDQSTLLVKAGIPVEMPASLDVARKRSAALMAKFLVERKAATLTRGVGWSNLLGDIKTATADVATNATKSWKAYRYFVFTGDQPSVVKARLAMTSPNIAAFSRYEKLHQAFRGEFDRLPVDQAAIERVRTLATDLTKIAKDFDFDVEEDVKLFLEAIQNGGARLVLLTDNVLEWLKTNNAHESYRVIPVSR